MPVPAYRSQPRDSDPSRVRADRKLRRIALPNGKFRLEHYDFVGRLHIAEDPDGRRLFCSYDAEGRLTKVRDSAKALVTYAHDPERGELAARTDRTESIIRVDSQRRPRELFIRIDNLEWTIGFKWSTQGKLTGVRYPQTADWLSFDGNHPNLEWKCAAQVHLTGEATRDPRRSRIRYSNGASVLEELAVARRPLLNRISHCDGNGDAIIDYLYQYDESGRITRAGSEQFDYDSAGRLTRCSFGEERRYRYDDRGRLLEMDHGVRLNYNQEPMVAVAETENGETLFKYDAVGRRLRKETSAGATDYQYDGFGQLCAIRLPNGEAIEYVYDGFGRLVARQTSAGCVYYITDLQGHRLAEADDDGRIVRSYLWVGAQCGARIEGTADQPISQTFHRAHAGRLVASGDAAGRLTPVSTNDPFGGDSPIDEGSPAFASLFGDPATHLLYAGSRWLDPTIAQFLTPDTWFGRDVAAMFPPSARRYARATPGGPNQEISTEAAYVWCGHDPVNRTDPNGHSWYGLILTGISALVWSLQATTVAIELEIFNIIAEILQWFPLFRPKWDWEGYKQTSIFNISAPVASSRLNVPLAFVLNGFLTNHFSDFRAWTMGNVIWARGSNLRGLEASSKRDLLICPNASSYVAAVEEVAAQLVSARNPFARATAKVDATGLHLTGVTVTVPAGIALADVFTNLDSVSIRKPGDPTDETSRKISAVGVGTLDFDDALLAPLPGQAVEIARLDQSIVKIEKDDSVIARKVTFIRGTSIHYGQQIPEGFPVDTLTVTEFMPAGKRNLVTADSHTEFYVVRLAAAADQALYAVNDFIRVRSGSTYFARTVERTRGAKDLILTVPLDNPTPPASYSTIEVVKMDAAGAAVLTQTAAGDHVNVGNVVDLRKFDGLAVENTGGAPVTTERRIVLSTLMDCQVAPLDAGLHGAPVKIEQMNVDASRQADGTNTAATVVTTAAGEASRFATNNWVRVRKSPATDAFSIVTAVDNKADTITLRDDLPPADFPNGTAVTVTLLAVGRQFEGEDISAPGDHVKIKSDNPGDLNQGDIIRITLKSNTSVAAARLISSAPTVVAVVDSALPASHAANLTVTRFTAAAATLRSNASAPPVQLRFTAHGGAPPFSPNPPDDLVFLTGKNQDAFGKVFAVTGQDIFLTDPVDHLLGATVDISSIVATGLTTNGANLDEALVLVPSAVLSTDSDDPDLDPLTHREALVNHEMRHVFQYALWGPFFLSLPLPWLVSLGFSFSDWDQSASNLARHFGLGGADSALAGIVYGIGKAIKHLPSHADLTGALDADLKTVTFAAGTDADKIGAFSKGSPVSISKDGFSTGGAIAQLDANARTITLRVALRKEKFAVNDQVRVSVSAFEKIRKAINKYLGSIDQLWSDRIPTSWGRVLSKFLNRDSWTPLLGIYFLSLMRAGGDQRRVPMEQDAAFHSGDLYSSIALSVPNEIFVGQFAAIYGFIDHRSTSPTGDVATGLSLNPLPLEQLTVELPIGVDFDKVSGAILSATLSATAGQVQRVRFRENWYIPMNEKVENVIGALFAASVPGKYLLHVPGELGPDEDVVFQGAAPLGFLEMKKITVKALAVTPLTDAGNALVETEEVLFLITGDSQSAEYRIRYKGTVPGPAGTLAGLRFTAPKLAGGSVVHTLEITATYPENHPVFHRPAQSGNIRLTADQRTNPCQDLEVNIKPIDAPVIADVAAGGRVDFDTPIAARSVLITSPLPAGAATPARVILGTGKPAHNTFFAPNAVTAATNVTFQMVFGTAPNEKSLDVNVNVTP